MNDHEQRLSEIKARVKDWKQEHTICGGYIDYHDDQLFLLDLVEQGKREKDASDAIWADRLADKRDEVKRFQGVADVARSERDSYHERLTEIRQEVDQLKEESEKPNWTDPELKSENARLKAVVERQRTALEKIAYDDSIGCDDGMTDNLCMVVAKKALTDKEVGA